MPTFTKNQIFSATSAEHLTGGRRRKISALPEKNNKKLEKKYRPQQYV